MVRFHTLTSIAGARLWIFRDRTPQTSSENAHDAQDLGPDAHGFRLFQDQLDHQVHEVAHAMLHDAGWKAKEKDAHIRTLPRAPGHFFPSDLWLVEGTQRVLESDPLASARSQVRVHLVLAGSYAGGTLFTWTRGGVAHTFEQTGVDADGPYFDVTLAGGDQSFVCFKFRDARGKDEPDSANRLWVASDGGEIWVFSGLTEIMSARPVPGSLRLRLFDFGAPVVPELHLWRDGTALADLSGTRRGDGWVGVHAAASHRPTYWFKFRHRGQTPEWEHDEATCNVFLDAAGAAWTTDGDNTDRKLGAEVWTLEGDHELYAREPVANRRVELLLSACEPSSPLTLATTSHMHVWINRARWPLTADVTPNAHGVFAFDTYPEVVTSFRFGSAGSDERLARHYLKVKATDPNPLRRFIVLSGRIRCRGRRIRTCFAILLSLSAARSRAALSRHEVVNRAMATHAEARRVSTPSVVSTRRTFRWSTRRRRARDPSHLP